MFSSYRDDSSYYNGHPALENRGQPSLLPGTSSKQTAAPPWDYSQQTLNTMPFYSGDNFSYRHPVVQNPNSVPHVENSSLLSNYNKSAISATNVHQSVVRPRAVINCQTNCDACYSHSFTRFPPTWSVASSDCVKYGGGSSVTDIPSNDIPTYPPNFPQTDDHLNRYGEDFPSTLNKLPRFSKDAQGVTGGIPKKPINYVTDSHVLIQQNHSRGTAISEQYVSSLAVDDVATKTEVCHNACQDMCAQGACKIYKRLSMKTANLNSIPYQPYGVPRENVVKYKSHKTSVNGGSHWHTENHQPSKLWLSKGHPPDIWIPPQEFVTSFEHSNAPNFWAERDICNISTQQLQSQNYKISSSIKSANQIRTMQSSSYKENMDDNDKSNEKTCEQIPFHQNTTNYSRYSADVMKRGQEDITTAEHAPRYMEVSQRNQHKSDNTGTSFSQDLHYQKLTGRNSLLSSKSFPENEVNKERFRDPSASTVLQLQNATKAMLNSNETIENYTPLLDPHNDISKKCSFSAPVSNYPTYQNHDGKFHSPVLDLAQPPSRFGSHLTYSHSKIPRNSSGIFPATYVDGSCPLSCQLPADNDSFLKQHLSYDSNKDNASNVIHCSVQNPDAVIRCGPMKDTLEAIVPQMALGLQSCDKITNSNVTGCFGTSVDIPEMDNTSKSGNVNPAAYNKGSVVTNSFQDNAHCGLYQPCDSIFAPNAFINDLNYSSKRYTSVPVISRSDKEPCRVSAAYDTSYCQNSPLVSEGSPDRPIKKRKSRLRNVDNMEKRVDNSRNNHILDVRQFLETWDEEMDLSPAPRLPDVVLSSSSAENPLLVLDCRQLSTKGVATLSAVDRSTGDLMQTYQQPVDNTSENNELTKHAELQLSKCANLLPLNSLEEINSLCGVDQKSDTKIIKHMTPNSVVVPQEMPLSNLVAAEFSLNDEVSGVDTCSVSGGVIQGLLLPSQKFQNSKIDKNTDISDIDPLHECELNKGHTPSLTYRSPHMALQVSKSELADPRRDCRKEAHISDFYSNKKGSAILECHTKIIPEVQSNTSKEMEEHLKKSRIQTLKQLCEYVLQKCGTAKHCFENSSQATNKNIISCRVPLRMSHSKPVVAFSSMPNAAGTSINVQNTAKVYCKQTVELSYVLNVSSSDKTAFETSAYSVEDNILENTRIDLDNNELWVKHSDLEKQTCLSNNKSEITAKLLEDKCFKQSAEDMYEKTLKDKLNEGNADVEESCELYDNTAKILNKIGNLITTEISKNKSEKTQMNQNSDTHAKGSNLLLGDGDLNLVTNKIPESKTTLNKNPPDEPCFGIDIVDFSQRTFNIVNEESEVCRLSNRSEKSDNCESTLITTMRSTIPSVLANSGSESDDKHNLGLSVVSSIHSDLDVEHSQLLETNCLKITCDEPNELYDADVIETDELMHSNMAEVSDITCSSAFEASYSEVNDSKGHEKNETETHQCRDDFSLLEDSLMESKIELTKCNDHTSEVIQCDKLIGRTLVEENIKLNAELQTEQENISDLQKSSFGSSDERLNISRNVFLNTLRKKISKSNHNAVSAALRDDMTIYELNEESVETLELDENQNQSSSAKLKSAARDQNDSVPSFTITKSWARIKDCTDISYVLDKSTKVHEPSQKPDKPAFDSIEIEYVNMKGPEVSNKVANVSIMATMCKPKTKDCSTLTNFADASAKDDVSLQGPLDLLADCFKDVRVDFKCAEALAIGPNGCSISRALLTNSNNETKDYSQLPCCSSTSAKEDEHLKKTAKSFRVFEHLNQECSEMSTASDCILPNTKITKLKHRAQDYSNECSVVDNELALTYDPEERENKANIASDSSSLVTENVCELDCNTALQNNSPKQNILNLNPVDLLQNVFRDSHDDESEQKDADNIKKMSRNEEGLIDDKKNLVKNILETTAPESESKKINIESVFPRVVNLYTAVNKCVDICCSSDNNYGINLFIDKHTYQEEEQSKLKKMEYVEQTSEKQPQALEVIDNDTKINSHFQNFSTYSQNNHIDDLQVPNSCAVKSVSCEKIDTKYSENCLCFRSSAIKEERSLQEYKFRSINACCIGKEQMSYSRIKTKSPLENEIIVNNVLKSVFQKCSNFAFNDDRFHAGGKREEEKQANSVYRKINASENASFSKLQNMNANIEVAGKLRCASRLLSEREINVNTLCCAVLESTAALKQQHIKKANNISNIILKSGDMSLRSKYVLQKSFSKPLIRNYDFNMKNKIKLKGFVSVNGLNYVHLSDALAEILRKNKIQIIVTPGTCNSRSGITYSGIIEAHKAYSQCLNMQTNAYYRIERLNPRSKALLSKNKNAVKRKISQCISDDELYHSFSKTLSKTQKKRNTEGNCSDSEKEKIIPIPIIETRNASKNSINSRVLSGDPLTTLSKTKEVKKAGISLHPAHSINTFPLLVKNFNFNNGFMIEDASSKLNISVLLSETSVENKQMYCKENKSFQNSNLQHILEFIHTTDNYKQGNNNEGVQECDNDDKHILMNGDTCMALMQRNTIVKENDKRKESLCITNFQEDNAIVKCDLLVEKIHDDMALRIPDDYFVEKVQDDLLVKIEGVSEEKVKDDTTEKIQDCSKQNRNTSEHVITDVEECEMKQFQEMKENDVFQNCHNLVKFTYFQRNIRTCVPKAINDSVAKQERDDKNCMHLRASQNTEEEIVATRQKQEIEIIGMALKKTVEERGKEAVVSSINEVPLSPNILRGEPINSYIIQNNIMYFKDITPNYCNMRDILNGSRECDKASEAGVDKINNIPFPKANTGNMYVFKSVDSNVYKQAGISNKYKWRKQGGVQILCDLHGISNAHREKAFSKSLVNDKCIETVGGSCHMTTMQEVTVQETVLNKQSNSKIDISSNSHNIITTDEPCLVKKPKSKNCGNLKSLELYMNKAPDISAGSIVIKMGTRRNKLGLLPVVRKTNLIVRNINLKVELPQHISEMQKTEEFMEETEDICAEIEASAIVKIDAQSVMIMHRGYSKSLKVIAKDIIQNLKQTKDKIKDAGSMQIAKHEKNTVLSATKGLNFSCILFQSTNLAANSGDQEKEKEKLKWRTQNKTKCLSSLRRVKSADYMKKVTGSINISLRGSIVPDLFGIVKKKRTIEEHITENSSMENVHDADAYVDMPHLEAISTEIVSNDSEIEMPCLELIDDLEPMEIDDHVQELSESYKSKENAEHCAVVESTEGAGEIGQEESSVREKICVKVNTEFSSNPEIYVEVQNLPEKSNHFQQAYMEAASNKSSLLYILKDKSFIDNISTTLKLHDKKPEAKAPIDYSVLKSALPIGDQNAQNTCESNLKLSPVHTDGWNDLGVTEKYIPQLDNNEIVVGKEMHFADKEKLCAEAELPRRFLICTESDSITPLHFFESETEYTQFMNDDLNIEECWTSEKVIDDSGYTAEEAESNFNKPLQVCSDVLMSNCEPELNVQESFELDIPSLAYSAPSHLESPEIGSSLGDVIPADFVTNWPYLEEEVLCEVDNNPCSTDSDYQTVHSGSPTVQCLPSSLHGSVNSSASDSDPSNVLTDTALGGFKCSLSWKKIFNVSKLDRKQRKNFRKIQKEEDNESVITSMSKVYHNMSDAQHTNKRQNCMPLSYHTNTSALRSNKEFGGLELGPAKIEVRIPRLAGTKGLPKVWKVVKPSKPFNIPEAQKENTKTSAENTDVTGQVPIVVVKRLILKRGYDDEDVDKAKKRKHSHKKTIKPVNTLQVNDMVYKSACFNETPVVKEFKEKPTDDTIIKKNNLRNTNVNSSHCSVNAIEVCSTVVPSSAEGALARDMLCQNVRTKDFGSENVANDSCILSCNEKNFNSSNTEHQKVAQKIPKVIIKRTVGIGNTNKYKSFLTDDILSNHTRSSWNPVVRLERNASLDSLAKKLATTKKTTKEVFAQSQVRHGIKINLRSPPGTPAVTIVPLSSSALVNADNTEHSHKRRKHLYSRKKRGLTLEEQNSSVTSTTLNSSSGDHVQSSSLCPSGGWESLQETAESQVALTQNVTRLNLNDTNNLEDFVLVKNKNCTRKDFTKITFHRHKKKRSKTEYNKSKKKCFSNFEHPISGASKYSFHYIKNRVQKAPCQLNAFEFSVDESGKNSFSASEKSISEVTEQTSEMLLPSKNTKLNESQSTNFRGCITSRSKDYCISKSSDLLLTNPGLILRNEIHKQSVVKSNKRKKKNVEEEFTADEFPLFHPDRILTHSFSSKRKKPKFKDKSQPPNEQELEKEIKDMCLEMALPRPSLISRKTEETDTNVGDASENGKDISMACKSYQPQVAGLKLHNCPEMMCCRVNSHLYEQHEERVSHIKQHAFHCQQCHLSFKSEDDFINHLAEQHPHIKAKHHCLLCERTFSSAERHRLHLAGQNHRHLELIQRRTIHALFSLFTGHSCPVLEPLTESELTGLNWLPAEPGTIHFYHENTPLQRAIQNLMCIKERHLANVSTTKTSTIPVEEDSTTSEHLIK